jgi:hypothetical protein
MEGIKPDEFTYSSLLNTCHYLIPLREKEGKFSLMKAAFEICCKDGFVNEKHISILRQSLPEKQFLQLVGAENVATKFPQDWSQNESLKPNRK